MTRIPSLGPRGEGWVVIQVVLYVLVLAAGSVRVPVDGAPAVLLGVAGGVLIVAGLSLAARGLRDLRHSMTALPHPRDGAELVETGAYRLVRHPIYGGTVLAAAGWGLVTASPLALLGAVALLFFFRLKSEREEAWLRQRYPGYGEYAGRTRRMIPWLY